jgi:hypothetical protein
MKSGFCVCAITFQMHSTTPYEEQRGCYKERGGGGDEENVNHIAISIFGFKFL